LNTNGKRPERSTAGIFKGLCLLLLALFARCSEYAHAHAVRLERRKVIMFVAMALSNKKLALC